VEMNDRSLCEAIATFRLVTQFRLCHHHRTICACKYVCALVEKDVANIAKFDEQSKQ